MLNNIFEWRVLFYKTYKKSCFYAENWFKIWTVNQNLEFDSASYAASVVAGLGVNGLINWKIDGKTLKQIEASKAKSLDSTKSNQQA